MSFHREGGDLKGRDGFENQRVSLDRDRLIDGDGGYDMAAVSEMVSEKIGASEEVEVE